MVGVDVSCDKENMSRSPVDTVVAYTQCAVRDERKIRVGLVWEIISLLTNTAGCLCDGCSFKNCWQLNRMFEDKGRIDHSGSNERRRRN